MTNEEIVTRIQQGEVGLMGFLVEQNSRYVRKVAARYLPLAIRNKGADMDDLMQSAFAGMIDAISYWDPDRGGFVYYATFNMQRSIRQLLGISTSKKQIENELQIVSLSLPVSDDNDIQLIELIRNDNAEDPARVAVDADMRRLVRDAVRELPEPLRSVVFDKWVAGRLYSAILTPQQAHLANRKPLGDFGQCQYCNGYGLNTKLHRIAEGALLIQKYIYFIC